MSEQENALSQPTAPTSIRRWLPLIVAATVIALVAGGLGAFAYRKLAPQPGTCDVQQLATKVQPSLVWVQTDGEPREALGSGVIIRADGVILTNAHLVTVAKVGPITVLLPSGERLPAKLVGSDPISDLAVLKVDRGKLPAMPLAWGEKLALGQPLAALGSPLGEFVTLPTVTIGAFNRNVLAPKAGGGMTYLTDSIQLNAPMTEAVSGGAVVTCDGQLIGIATAVSIPPEIDYSGWGVSFGYAIPATIAYRVSQELLADGTATHPWTGLSVAQVSADVAVRHDGQPGLFVQTATTGSPATTAGLKSGDLITSLNGQAATSASYSRLLLAAKVGDQVAVAYLRDGQPHQATITLTEQPAN